MRFLHLLISHHSEDKYDRTLTLRIRGKEIHFCARCTGITVSLLISMFVIIILRISIGLFFDPFISLIFAVSFLIPTMIDWITQKLEFRESTNRIRISLGILLGVGISLLQFALLLPTITHAVIVIVVGILFAVIIYKNHKKYKIPSR